MHIISKFNDYYDIGQSYGIDKSLVYVRDTRGADTELDKSYDESLRQLRVDTIGAGKMKWRSEYRNILYGGYSGYYATVGEGADRISATLFVVGFCGKLYPCICLQRMHAVYDGNNGSYPTRYCYDMSVDKFVSMATSIMEQPPSKKMLEKIELLHNRFSRITSVFSGVACDDIMIKINAPCFVKFFVNFYGGVNTGITINPRLADYGFQAVKDSYTAFQDISMYLGGVIPKQATEMITISDKDRIVQHGFDKHSFRHPTKIKDIR